jgi:hypothetical protein
MCEGCDNASLARSPHTLGLFAKRKSLEEIEAFQMVLYDCPAEALLI